MVFDIQRWSIRDGRGIRTNVFLKGCPLRCQWCSNPESQSSHAELAFFPDKCIRCGRCAERCPHGAIRLTAEAHECDRSVCAQFCYRGEGDFPCVGRCYAEALKRMGSVMSVDTVMEEVLSDRALYASSGGGVTFTGGEPFFQSGFLLEMLKASKKNGLHTVVETCAYAPWDAIAPALPFIDFAFVDIKMMDSERHKRYTGFGNERILDNLQRMDEYARAHPLTIAIRTPVIGGVNDAAEDITATAAWIRSQLKSVRIYQLLPYHRLGRGKYRNLGKSYALEDIAPPAEQEMERLRQIVLSHGLRTDYD